MSRTMTTTHTLDPIEAIASADLAGSDSAAATAARLELIHLVADRAAPKGNVTPCVVAYKLPGEEFAHEELLTTDYAGIKAWFAQHLEVELAYYGLPMSSVFDVESPIPVAFGREMPAQGDMPDRLAIHGNDGDLMATIPSTFHALTLAKNGSESDMEMELTRH